MTDPIAKTEANDLPPAPKPVRDETMSRWGDDGGTVPLPDHAGKAAMPDAAVDHGSADNPAPAPKLTPEPPPRRR